MARRSEHSRDEIREMALQAAARIVEKRGAGALTARAVAGAIGYTAGSLYLVFHNLDDLILHLNARTLDELDGELGAAAQRQGDAHAALLALAETYVRYAFDHRARWALIFEHTLANGSPQWYTERVARLFALAEARLEALADRRRPTEIRQAARALWGGVHGVCVLGLTGRLDDSGHASVQALARSLVVHYLAGYAGSAGTRGARRRKKN